MMRYLSLFSGIEAATVAWAPLGWVPIAFCEIDQFPSAVLAARYPNVPNLGDITQVNWGDFIDQYGRPDLIVGGSPCQSFSVAGKREGLAGASGLMYEYIRAVQELRPRWFIWENVPGALTSEHGEAFRQLLASMDECGYHCAWRVLDAQFFGVPQRRRRVFLVGCTAEGRAAEVLFEPDSMRGDYPSSKQKRKDLAAAISRGTVGDSTYDIADKQHITATEQQSPTLTASEPFAACAFAQNQRDEVRLISGDETLAGAISASQFGTHKQETLLCMADNTSNAAIDEDLCGTLKVGGAIPSVMCATRTARTS